MNSQAGFFFLMSELNVKGHELIHAAVTVITTLCDMYLCPAISDTVR